MKEFNITLTLREDEGMILFDDNDQATITFQGYSMMNNIVNASIFMPDKITIDGELKENPYIVQNDAGEIIEVTSTSIACCQFNGNLVATTATVKMNVEVYLTNELMQLVASDKTCGHLLKKGTLQENSKMIFRPINDLLEIAVNIANPKVIKAFGDYTENKARGERRIQSISQRNALKKLPPFSGSLKNIVGVPGERSGEITITLYGSEEEQKVTDILSIAKNINANVFTRDLVDINSGEIILANNNGGEINLVVDGDITNLADKNSDGPTNKVDNKKSNLKESPNQKKSKKDNVASKNESSKAETPAKSKKEVKEKETGKADAKRMEFIARYNKLKKGSFELAMKIMFPNVSSPKELNDNELDVVLKTAEKMITNQ